MNRHSETVFKRDEIVLLLGAGASVPADIPASQGMINRIEALLEGPWAEYKNLYFFVKSAVQYAEGIHGRFNTATFNVEKLVETLDDLRKGDEHPLYPFVGAWVPKLYEVAGSDLTKVTRFREEIVRRLRDDWIPLKYKEDAAYYRGIASFQQELQEPLRVFTLNYDLCVETALSEVREFDVERGFNEEKRWDWRRFEHEHGADPPSIYLYKLHGSIDWTRTDSEALTYRDAISQIAPEQLAIIFASPSKLQAIDPFLFFAYEFRKWTLEAARLIVTIGYGFADDHINGILKQSLKGDENRRLLSVTYIDNEKKRSELENDHALHIASCIGLTKEIAGEKIPVVEQIGVRSHGAEVFLREGLRVGQLSDLFPGEEKLFEEVPALGSDDRNEVETNEVAKPPASNGAPSTKKTPSAEQETDS